MARTTKKAAGARAKTAAKPTKPAKPAKSVKPAKPAGKAKSKATAAPAPQQKTFILGVGCQKGGTSWLHDYLSQHPNADLGFRKEYHVFDGLQAGDSGGFMRSAVRHAEKAISRGTIIDNGRDVFRRLSFYENVDNYFDYFWLLANRQPGVQLTGDITPAYATLPADMFRNIRDKLIERDFRVRVVFLMRDPVERCISAARMNYAKRDIVLPPDEEAAVIRAEYKKRPRMLRGRYDLTIQALDQVFKPEELFYCFYERLFSADTIRRLTDFLAIPYVEPDLAREVRVSRNSNDLDRASRREIANFYRETFDFVRTRFNEPGLAGIWKNYALET